ncbi:MAG: O-antigen ligase family protein [Alphaproteobacteria bacterium]
MAPVTRRATAPSAGRLAERIVLYGFLAIVFLAPLPFGSNRPWSWSMLSLSVGGLLFLWAVAAWRAPGLVRVPATWHLPLTIPFVLFLLWVAVQAASWTPASWHHEAWAEFEAMLGHDFAGAISLNPEDSWTEMMRIIAYGGAFWLAMQLGRERANAVLLTETIVAATGLYAFYGLVVYFSGNDFVLWYPKWAYPEVLTSTFVGRNNYATYAGMGVVVGLAMVFREIRNTARHDVLTRHSFFDLTEKLRLRAFLLGLAVLLNGFALLLTQSRGGFLATLAGVMTFGFVIMRRRQVGLRTWILSLGGLLVAVAFFMQIAGAGLVSRLGQTETGEADSRSEAYALSLEVIRDHPWIGTGLGTYQEVFHRYRDRDMSSLTPDSDHAHNTYLELWLETGLIGFVLLMSPIVLVTLAVARAAITRRRSYTFPAAALGVAVLVGVHALADFSVEMPAVALTFVALLGLGYSQSRHVGEEFT